jgi:hypothetical protein
MSSDSLYIRGYDRVHREPDTASARRAVIREALTLIHMAEVETDADAAGDCINAAARMLREWPFVERRPMSESCSCGVHGCGGLTGLCRMPGDDR